jgi:hypothetical protein
LIHIFGVIHPNINTGRITSIHTVDGLTDQKTPIARVTFRIIAPRTSTITFKNYTPDGTKETAVLDGDKKQLMTLHNMSMYRILEHLIRHLRYLSHTTPNHLEQ